MRLRLAREADAFAIRAIYAPIVAETTTSFEYEPPTEAEVARRIRTTLATHPWLVAEIDTSTSSGSAPAVMGYAYAGPHRSRTAYQWSAEVSVYVHADARRRGVARALYVALFDVLRLQGYVNAYAGITQPNAPSVAFHEALGFEPVGVYRGVGFKHGAWHDVAWSQLRLREDAAPAPPRPLPDVVGTEAWRVLGL